MTPLRIPTREAVLRALARAGLDLADVPPEPEHGTIAWLIWADTALYAASRHPRFLPPAR